jgi:hypothetical protein
MWRGPPPANGVNVQDMDLRQDVGQPPAARSPWVASGARLTAAVAVLAAVLAMPSPASSGPHAPAAALQAAGCRFVLGFAGVREAIGPEVVGTCLEDERFNPANGNAEQRTTGGLLVWRKADNWTAFTDGYHTWVNGPNGLEQRLNGERFPWENDPVIPTPAATPSPLPATPPPLSPTPSPTATAPPASATPVPSASSTPAPTPSTPALPPVDAALRDASSYLGLPRDQLQVERFESRTWSDGSLGCPQPGRLYPQVITPGYLVIISGGGQRLEYHTNERDSVVLCATSPARSAG